MSNTVIKIENLSKQYRLGSIGTGSLAHDVNRAWHRIRGNEDPYLKIGESNDRTQKGFSEYVWALKDVNFEIKHGEVMGIIGRNGAGKSTLLKILSRTTSPTIGSVKIKGRVASLLEVGTGFHPELTGRENIFLNGAILGMTKKEIKRKFDEIVDFAGVERYIDTPVKRYSSGMYVRLAFGVAAHLEPEILIVDEVLAVGDAEFQKKALGKMKDVSNLEGRTVLFVSHNMAAVKSICNTGLLLKDGTVNYINNSIEKVVSKYYEFTQSKGVGILLAERTDREGNANVFIKTLSLLNTVDNTQIEQGEQLGFEIIFTTRRINFPMHILLSINNSNGDCVLFMDSSTVTGFPSIFQGSGRIKIKISEDFGLPTGRFFINIAAFVNEDMADYIQNALVFDVVDGLFYEGGKIPAGRGLCYVQQEWKYQVIDE